MTIPIRDREDRRPTAATRVALAAGLAAVMAAGLAGPATAQNVRRPLHDGWSFRQVGTDEWLPATVPGGVHTDLLAAGRIADPFVGKREPQLQWIEDRDWEYATRFTIPATDASARDPSESDGRSAAGRWHTELVFHGLDTFAEVRVDGRSVVEADNMFRRWTVELPGALAAGGDHELRVVFRSPVPIGDSLATAYPTPLHAGHDPSGTRPFVRKAAYHFGWDWGPRYVTSGIWRPVELHRWRGATLRDAFVAQESLTDERAVLRARLRVEADAAADATLVVRSLAGLFPAVEVTRRLSLGVNEVAVPFAIDAPRRWWPNGLGEPYLYDVVIEVRLDGAVVDSTSRRVGLRTVRLVREPDSIGRSFHFEVNGEPVFMKGANTIPLDHFSTRVDSALYQRMFDDAVSANMNMLRVWGGGIYETDLFYRMADRAGILIWQDFMFANGLYPDSPTFLAGVRAEAEHQVRRLRGHPSIALWCGNNEIREAWENWSWQRMLDYAPADSVRAWRAYEQLFHELLPGVVAELDPARAYWPSSPSLGWGDPESLTRGDSHYWGVWHGEEPFEVLAEKLPRFMSEFGFQAYPPLATIEQFTESEDRQVGSPVMLAHQKNARGDELIRLYMARDYPEPADFADFVYLSQLMQAEGMALGIEAQRRAMPRTMGTLYWQLGDTWPAVSWSGIDWYGTWKALHYFARRAFEPVLVSTVLDGDVIRVHLVSDRRSPAAGTLTVRTVPFTGGEAFRLERTVELPVNGSAVAMELPLDDVLGGPAADGGGRDPAGSDAAGSGPADPSGAAGGRADPHAAVVVAELVLDDGTRSRDLLYVAPPKDLALPDPRITTTVRPGADGWVVDVHAAALARAVRLTADGAHFKDNWFDLLPGETRTVGIETDRQEPPVAREEPESDTAPGERVETRPEDAPVVRVRSLVDSGG